MENYRIVGINQITIKDEMTGPLDNINSKPIQKPKNICHVDSINLPDSNTNKSSPPNFHSTNFHDQHNYNMKKIYEKMLEDKKRHEMEMNKLL